MSEYIREKLRYSNVNYTIEFKMQCINLYGFKFHYIIEIK